MEDKYKGGFTDNDTIRILPNFDFASLYPATQRYYINDDDKQISLLHELARKRQLLRLKEQRKKKLEKINNL